MIHTPVRFASRSALALAVLALLGVAPATHAADAAMSAQAKALAALDAEWSKTTQSRDAAKVAAYYAEDAHLNPPGNKLVVGRAAAQKLWAAMFVDPSFKISWTGAHVDVAKSGELGYVTGSYEDSFKGKDGKLVKETGKFLEVWQKQADGSWKCIHDMWNGDAA
jgi:ketosteroid isomerase-like protein